MIPIIIFLLITLLYIIYNKFAHCRVVKLGGLVGYNTNTDCMWSGGSADEQKIRARFSLHIANSVALDNSTNIMYTSYAAPYNQQILNLYNGNSILFPRFAGMFHQTNADRMYIFYEGIRKCEIHIHPAQSIVLYKSNKFLDPNMTISNVITATDINNNLITICTEIRQKNVTKDVSLQPLGIQNASNQCYFNSAVQLAVRAGFADCPHPDLDWLRSFYDYMDSGSMQLHNKAQSQIAISPFLRNYYDDNDITLAGTPINLAVQSDPDVVLLKIINIADYYNMTMLASVQFLPHSTCANAHACTIRSTQYSNHIQPGNISTLKQLVDGSYHNSTCGVQHQFGDIQYVKNGQYLLFASSDNSKQILFGDIQDITHVGIKYSLVAMTLYKSNHFIAAVKHSGGYAIISDSNVTAQPTHGDLTTYINTQGWCIQNILIRLN